MRHLGLKRFWKAQSFRTPSCRSGMCMRTKSSDGGKTGPALKWCHGPITRN